MNQRYVDLAAAAALTAAQSFADQQWLQVEAERPEVEREYQRRKEAARQYLAEQNEARDTIRRLYAKVNSGDVDIFR